MRAREYRIGNYVTVRGVIQFIIGIESNNDWNVEDGLGAFETIRTNVNPMNMSKDGLLYVSETEPIPLTEEWLLKFDWNGYKPLHFNSNFEIDKEGRLYCNSDYKGVNVKYVHQLQNLYFALTGKELTTKNDTI